MSDTALWRLIQSWMDGQIVRVNQSQLAEALGVNRQSLTQWKQGQARPSPDSLRALRRVTRLDWHLLTDALLKDMGYVETEETSHGTPTRQAGASPAVEEQPAATLSEHVERQLSPEAQDAIRAERERLAEGTKRARPNG